MGAKKESVITEQVDSRMDDLFGEDDGGQDTGPEQEGIPDDSIGQSATELDNRLDNFFEKEDKPEKMIDPKKLENSKINDLKSVILSLEWEITDQVMQKLGEEIHNLEQKCKDDKIVIAFLQLLGSLGKYIRKKRADAHPDSIRLLNSVYENLEMVMLSDALSDAEKKKMLVTQVGKYKKLKEEIVVGKPAGSVKAEKAKAVTEIPEPDADDSDDTQYRLAPEESNESGGSSQESSVSAADSGGPQQIQAILKAMEEIRGTIQSEFRALKEEIKLLRKG